MKLQEQTDALFVEELVQQGLIASQYRNLQQVKSRTLQFPGCRIVLTYNPARIRSTAAKIDARSLAERPCFLCADHRPAEQKALNFENRYSILVNPYPIFRRHLTIPDQHHLPQEMTTARLKDMLQLARLLPGYTLFYNGPGSGASAPDHFHFQAGERQVMPSEEESGLYPEILYSENSLKIATLNHYLRYILIAESPDPEFLLRYFQQLTRYMSDILPEKPEPRMNLHVFYESAVWHLLIFPRKELRPRQFYKEGKGKILFSPGAVDMGGMWILPREEDYLKITPAQVEDMFRQVTYNPADFQHLCEKIKKMRL